MARKTDPALELAELCERLVQKSSARGDRFLAEKFSVEPWTKEFHEIVACIVSRAEDLLKLVSSMDLDKETLEAAAKHLRSVQTAFSGDALIRKWDEAGSGMTYLRPETSGALRMLSISVRHKVTTLQLDEAETLELVDEIDGLLNFLATRQIEEADFLRQGLIDGLIATKFRLLRLKWLGSGYVIKSLRDLMDAHMALEGRVDLAPQPDFVVALNDLRTLVGRVYRKIAVAKEVTETGGFLLQWYALGDIGMKALGFDGLVPPRLPGS